MNQFTLLSEALFEWKEVQQVLRTNFAVRNQPSQNLHRSGVTDKPTCSNIGYAKSVGACGCKVGD